MLFRAGVDPKDTPEAVGLSQLAEFHEIEILSLPLFVVRGELTAELCLARSR